MTIDVSAEVKAAHMKQILTASQGARRVTIRDVKDLFDNQHPALQDHLQHEGMARMLGSYKTAPRSLRPYELNGKVWQV